MMPAVLDELCLDRGWTHSKWIVKHAKDFACALGASAMKH